MDKTGGLTIPSSWQRRGLVLRGEEGGWGGIILGDPCVVHDEDIGGYRMFVFALPPGHAQAVCVGGDPATPGAWSFEGPLVFSNPTALVGEAAYKPYVVLDPYRANHAARVGGRYALLVVTCHEAKVVQRAWADSLSGPWELEDHVLIPRGSGSDFDAKHVDAVSGYYFADRDEIVYFYMGYPEQPQDRPTSPYGSVQAAAVETLGDDAGKVRKLGPILPPAADRGHWASGWVGGLQLLRGREHRWIAVVNASPTPPDPEDDSVWHEEPPPSLGGFATCDETRPISGWRWCNEPIEWIEDVPAEAIAAGEGVNLWRHHLLVLADGRLGLFYNSGEYFKESLYLKVAQASI